MTSPWPVDFSDSEVDGDVVSAADKTLYVSDEDIKSFQSIKGLVRSIRNARAEYKVVTSCPVPV